MNRQILRETERVRTVNSLLTLGNHDRRSWQRYVLNGRESYISLKVTRESLEESIEKRHVPRKGEKIFGS